MSNSGNSLIMVLVSVGITGILMLAVSSMISMQNKEMGFLQSKMSVLELRQSLLHLFNDAQTCSCHLNSAVNTEVGSSLSINTTGPRSHDIVLNSIRKGCDFNSPNNLMIEKGKTIFNDNSPLEIASIIIKNIYPTGSPQVYSGEITIDFNQQKLLRPLQSLKIPIRMLASQTLGTPSSRPITSCASDQSSSIFISGSQRFTNSSGSLSFTLKPGDITPSSILIFQAHTHKDDVDVGCLNITITRDSNFIADCLDEGVSPDSPALHCSIVQSHLEAGTYQLSFTMDNATCGAPSGAGPADLSYMIIN